MGVPYDVTAVATSSSSITVSWTAVAGATGYKIYRSVSSNGQYDSIGIVTSTSYTNTGLSAGTTYYYKVAAYNNGGTGAQSAPVSLTIIGVPSGVTAKATSSNSITVSWSSVTGAVVYNIYRSTASNGAYDYVVGERSTTYTNIGLTAGTTYYYKVAANSGNALGTQSDPVSATTIGVPSGLTATEISSNEITINWLPVSDAIGYYVYRSTTSGGSYSKVESSPISSTSYTNTGLSGGITYYYKVAAYNGVGTGTLSIAVFATTATPLPFTDSRNGKTYRIVTIGYQTWMAENLNYQTANSWCYNDYSVNCATYGRLYTWDAARSACPYGWHLPTNAEWNTLVDYAGGSSVAGKKLKTSSWNGTDDYGFSALPGGRRIVEGSAFGGLDVWGDWWTDTELDASAAYSRNMGTGSPYVNEYGTEGNNKNVGFSVRCVQD
jgi:uncharacterized protein (TIGR02145 family)